MKVNIRKIVSLSLIGIAAVVVAIVVSFYLMVRLSVAPADGEIEIAGIDQPIEITFDEMGIPQIWAETERDGYFALGWLHAADRMFQMDLTRRVSQGRLSELLGHSTLEFDLSQRQVGHNRIAATALADLAEDNRHRLQAYADGINTYLENCRALPFEYRFLPEKFEEWEVVDCLALLSFQSWFSNALMSRGQFYSSLTESIGAEAANSLRFAYPDWAPVTVPAENLRGELPEGNNAFQRAVADDLLGKGRMPFLMTEASNAWVVGPERSAGGKAMLASDPHLETGRLPQFWYMVGLHIKQADINVLGITTPGLPFVVMGHNGRAAWAFTSGGIDVAEFRIQPVRLDDTRLYQSRDGWEEFTYLDDTIKIAGQDPVEVVHRFTHHGVVVAEGPKGDRVRTLWWAGWQTDHNRAIGSGFRLHATDNYEEFRDIVTGLGALDANMMYADAEGNIGYQLGTPLTVWPSDTTADPPYSFHALDQTPHAYNPASGWIASCNNRPDRSENYTGTFFSNRILRITDLLDTDDLLTVEDMARFQMDRHDAYLMRWKDETARLLDVIGKKEQATLVREWDGSTDVDSKAMPLVHLFLKRMKQLTFADELGGMYGSISKVWLDELHAAGGTASWFDNKLTPDTVEQYEDVAREAIMQAVAGSADRTWGEMQTLSMRHPLAMIPVLKGWLDLEPVNEPWGGSSGSLNASFGEEVDPAQFSSQAGPSWRFVIDFADVDGATFVLPAGNSGNPAGKHFLDFLPLWKSGERWNVPFDYEKVREKAASTLVLKPE